MMRKWCLNFYTGLAVNGKLKKTSIIIMIIVPRLYSPMRGKVYQLTAGLTLLTLVHRER